MNDCEFYYPTDKMVISLDFDETYTRDPKLWNTFIALARMQGHMVYVVTMRYEKEGAEVIKALNDKVDGIYFTGRKAKQRFMYDIGIAVNVWIDDMPLFVLMDAKK